MSYASQIEGGILGTVGTIFALEGADKAGRGSGKLRNFGDEIGGMPIGDYLSHLGDLGDRQFDWNSRQAAQDLALYSQFQGKQTEGQLRSAKAELSLYPMFAAAERAETARQRDADLSYLGKKGVAYRNVLSGLSPAYAGLDNLAASISAGGGTTPLLDYLNAQAFRAGPSAIRSRMEGDALYELGLGADLTPEQMRDATQSARAGWADRGLAYSTPAVASEILNRDAVAQQRLAARRAQAQQVWQMGQTEDQANRGFQISVQGANEDALQRRVALLSNISSQQLSPILSWAGSRAAVNPLMPAGAMQLAPGVGIPASVMSTAPQVQGMAGALSPLYNYGADLYNTNFNAEEARALNKANAYTSLGSGLIAAGAQVSGSGGGGGGGGGSSSMSSAGGGMY